jgi:hypothetical protein
MTSNLEFVNFVNYEAIAFVLAFFASISITLLAFKLAESLYDA